MMSELVLEDVAGPWDGAQHVGGLVVGRSSPEELDGHNAP